MHTYSCKILKIMQIVYTHDFLHIFILYVIITSIPFSKKPKRYLKSHNKVSLFINLRRTRKVSHSHILSCSLPLNPPKASLHPIYLYIHTIKPY